MNKGKRDGQILAYIELLAIGISSIIIDIRSIPGYGYTVTMVHMGITLALLFVMGILTLGELTDNYVHGILFFIVGDIILVPMLVMLDMMYYLHMLLMALFLMTAMYKSFRLCKTYMLITLLTYPFTVAVRWFLRGPYEVFTLRLVVNIFILLVCEFIIGTFVGNDERNRKIIRDNSQSSKDMLKVVQMKRMEAEQSAKSRAVFLANISHEIRTPINAIIGLNEMIIREEKDGNILDYCEDIRAAGDQLISLINDILDTSKIDSGSFTIADKEYDVRRMIAEVIKLNGSKVLKDKGKKNRISMKFSVSPDIPERLSGDELRITQIMNNLISNAIKYTMEGNIELKIGSVKNIMPGTIDLIISVRDTGIGIRQEDLERMLQRYVRLEDGVGRGIEGTGLGLSITSYLVEAMDGHLDIESEYGRGSVFTATVRQRVIDYTPIGEFDGDSIKSMKKSDREYKPVVRMGKSILIVDDNELNLRVAKGLLKHTGLNVDTCDNGFEALGLVKKNKYDLILLDHMMPDMDGIETLQRLRSMESLCRFVPVAVLTANATIGSREYYLEAGFNDYLSKPIVYEELEELIARYIGGEKEDESGLKDSDAESNHSKGILGAGITERELNDVLGRGGYDVKAGLTFSNNDIEIYLEMLQMFAENSHSSLAKLEVYLRNADMLNYAIVVHSLKGNAKSIGATDLYNRAYKHEQAAKEEDIDWLNSDWNELNKLWRQAVETVMFLGKKC